MRKLFRLRWFCPTCDAEHTLSEPLEDAIDDVRGLMDAGILMVAVYDETYAVMCDQDKAEEYSGLSDLSCTAPRSTLGDALGKFKGRANRWLNDRQQ
jgi:hypothetical protein